MPEPVSPAPAPPAPMVMQSETPNPQGPPPMQAEAVRVPSMITPPIVGSGQVFQPTSFGNPHPRPMPAPIVPQHGTFIPGPGVPMEPAPMYPMPYMPPMDYYQTVMPMPYGGYQPHSTNYITFPNGSPTLPQCGGTVMHQSDYNSMYRPQAEIPSLPGHTPPNPLPPSQPLPKSLDNKDADARPPTGHLPLPSFQSLDSATKRHALGESSQLPQRCPPRLPNPTPAKRRRVETTGRQADDVQANSMNVPGRRSDEKGSTVEKEMPKSVANAPISSPSRDENESRIANTGSTQKSTPESSVKSRANMNISDIVNPSEKETPFSNQTHIAQSFDPSSFADVSQIRSQHAPPYPGAPVAHIPHNMMAVNNLGPNYVGYPHHNPFKHYPSVSRLLWKPAYSQGNVQGYGNNYSGQPSNRTGTQQFQAMGSQYYPGPGQHGHPMQTGYPYKHNNDDPQPSNGVQNRYGAHPSQQISPVRQKPIHIAPAPPGSSPEVLPSKEEIESSLEEIDLPDRIYDLAAIEKAGCKILNWKVYNQQSHPVCAAPRENGTPCRRNVSRSACKWHGVVVPLSINNTTNGQLDTDGNLVQAFTPQTQGLVDGNSRNRRGNDRPLRSRASRTEERQEHTRILRWSDTEHFLFLLGYREFGKSWSKIARVVKTRTTLQTQSHAQKFFERRRKQEKKKSTIHDLVFDSPEMQAIYNNTPKEVLDGYLARAFARNGGQTTEEHSENQKNSEDQERSEDQQQPDDKQPRDNQQQPDDQQRSDTPTSD